MSQLELIRCPLLSTPHAFSTRYGGVSKGHFASLNLDDRADEPSLVAENRRRLTSALDCSLTQIARLEQVHGCHVVTVEQGGVWTGDALVTNHKNILLAIATADCYPILLADEQAQVIGAAHAGWKGTLGHIASATIEKMLTQGATKQNITAAIGTGICSANYPVSPEVAQKFEQANLQKAVSWNTDTDSVHLDLQLANQLILEECGIKQVWMAGGCSTQDKFYSYRRDQGKTGRMWSVIGLR